VAREAVAWCLGRGLDPHANIDDQLVMSEDDRNAADYERSSGIEARFVPDLMAELERWPTKILAAGASGRPEALLDEVRATFRGRAQVTVSHPEYLEFTAPGVTKGQALRWVARRLRVPIRQVLAIGDQYNDLEMLAAAGHGVAMGQSPLRVRAAARYVTGSIDEDGAARALEALVLGQAELPEGVACAVAGPAPGPRTILARHQGEGHETPPGGERSDRPARPRRRRPGRRARGRAHRDGLRHHLCPR
jgi:hydroxymethylpyrimidine pyrophosphatase-like HAD family hydrolase